jgi:hypothetical protein
MSANLAIISATIAVVTLVLAIFGASWLNRRNIERLLEQLEKRFDARFDTVLTEKTPRPTSIRGAAWIGSAATEAVSSRFHQGAASSFASLSQLPDPYSS